MTATMNLLDRLAGVAVLEPKESAGLQAFGLRWPEIGALVYTTLDDGLAAGRLEVTEVSDGGNVPTLKVTNKGEHAAFLMAGEQLAGGKQNRVLNASILVPAHGELPIPVSCVERGRWAYRSAQFGSAGSLSHTKLRMLMSKHATEGFRSFGMPTSRQGEVWQEVDRKLLETCSDSATHVLQKAYEDTEVNLRQAVVELTPPEHASGVVFAFAGRIVGFDLFDRPETLRKLWPKLIRAYAIDARLPPTEDVVPVTRENVESWLRSATLAKEEVFKSPGLGEAIRVENDQLVGAGLVVGEQAVHIEGFANQLPA